MTRKELNLAIFEGRATKVLWQPRLETWIRHHMERDTMPPRFKGLSALEIYDRLRCSVRYAASRGIERYQEPLDIERGERRQGNIYTTWVRISAGELRTVYQEVLDPQYGCVNRRIVEFPVKTPRDLKTLTALVERERFRANPNTFRMAAEAVGHRAEPTLFLSSSGFTELIKEYAGLDGTYYLLADYPKEVEEYLEACDRRDDRLIDAALQLPCRIFNLGDHATNEFTPPPILKKYMIPRWQKISRRLGEAGRFVHTHWDGHSRLMLPYLQETGLHGVEALTPKPMGDMTLEQIKEAVRDNIVVLDLLPAIHFLENYPMKEVLEFARRVIDMFAPRLILGISDEISQIGQIEKVEAVSELVDKVCGLAE
ncbi:MAG: hypothetical protein N3A38_02000 [Planctomycetota bacterium]|nr:hypothetical protein [Planctomycetota bacterium]